MKTKIVIQFTLLTLGITLLTWGGMVVLGQLGITLDNHPWQFAFFMLGGLSPTYVSYIVLKRNGEVTGFKEWLKNVFYVKSKISHYLLAVSLVVLFFGTQIAISGIAELRPLYMFFIGILISFVGGGLEEAGWRYILQPELNKKYGFILSAIITGLIWFAWHIPLFFIPGVGQYGRSLWMFAVNVLGMTFFYGAIIKVAGKSSVFLSVLAHTLTNAVWEVLSLYETWTGTIVTFVVMFTISSMIILLDKRQKNPEFIS